MPAKAGIHSLGVMGESEFQMSPQQKFKSGFVIAIASGCVGTFLLKEFPTVQIGGVSVGILLLCLSLASSIYTMLARR